MILLKANALCENVKKSKDVDVISHDTEAAEKIEEYVNVL